MSEFSRTLNAWYKKNARDLPWRRTRDPYKIWISEIMLQQTTVAAVIPYYEKWIKEFPAVQDVARAPLQKILKSWQGLGYYSRAKNIHRCAQILSRDYNGQLPRDPHVMKKLPGFGPYTTGAVLSIAFDQRQPIIDANVRRVAMRQLAIEGEAEPSHDPEILAFLDTAMPAKGNSIFNQALMELGALVCRTREPLCIICPVRSNCRAFRKGLQEIIPTPKKRAIKDVEVAVGVIQQDGKYFIQRRPSQGLFADLWEFPGGKIEGGETAKEALVREIKEELGVGVRNARFLFNVQQFYTQFRANLHVWACELDKKPQGGDRRRWVRGQDFSKYPMPSGSARIVEKLLC